MDRRIQTAEGIHILIILSSAPMHCWPRPYKIPIIIVAKWSLTKLKGCYHHNIAWIFHRNINRKTMVPFQTRCVPVYVWDACRYYTFLSPLYSPPLAGVEDLLMSRSTSKKTSPSNTWLRIDRCRSGERVKVMKSSVALSQPQVLVEQISQISTITPTLWKRLGQASF